MRLHVWAKNLFFFVLGGMIPLSIVGVLLSFLWVRDIRNDRQHTIVVNAATPVFVGTGHGDCDGILLTTVEKGSKLPVRRIRYSKGSLRNVRCFPAGWPNGVCCSRGW
jgi:hypothetical protein